MGSIVRIAYLLHLRSVCTHLFQHHQFQPGHLSLLNVPHARQNSNVHASRLSSPPLRPLPRRPRCSLRRLNSLPSRFRYERPQAAPTRPTMVHFQALLRCTRPEARWILPASQSLVRLYHCNSVCLPTPNPPTYALIISQRCLRRPTGISHLLTLPLPIPPRLPRSQTPSP
jgi:hypothetical protein